MVKENHGYLVIKAEICTNVHCAWLSFEHKAIQQLARLLQLYGYLKLAVMQTMTGLFVKLCMEYLHRNQQSIQSYMYSKSFPSLQIKF